VTERTLLVTLTGRDQPGVTAELFGALSVPEVRVLDVEQVVVRGTLTLGVLVAVGQERDEGTLVRAADRVGKRLGLRTTTAVGYGDNQPRPRGRLAVTLLAHPLTPAALAALTGAVAAAGGNIDRVRRLSREPVTTLELDVSGGDAPTLRRALVTAAGAHGVDVAVSPAGLARRGRRLVVMDVDSTLIRDEVIELLAEHAGRRAEVAAVTAAAMRGELDFAQSLHRRVAVLAGLDAGVLDDVRAAVRLTPGARTLVRTLHELGFTVALVSGGFMEVVGPLARSLGIVNARANRLEVTGGRLTGRVLGTVMDRPGKAVALRDFARLEGLPMSRTVAVGDGANDLDMLGAAGLGIAFNAKPVVRAAADAALSVPFLDAVLFLLGIPREEVEAADAAGD